MAEAAHPTSPLTASREVFVSYHPSDGFPWPRVSVAVARTAELPLPPTNLKVCDDAAADRMKWALSVFMGLCVGCTSGGLLHGWGPLQARLKQEWGFANVLCVGPHAYCGGVQQTFLQGMYCCAGLLGMTAGLLLAGILLDLIGPRWTAVFGLLVSAGGNLSMALAPWEAPWVFLLAFTLIALGGMGPFLASHHLLNYWREKHVALCALVTAFDSAGALYVLMQYTRWLSRAQWFGGLACLSLLFLVGCLALLPDIPAQIGEQCVVPALLWLPFFRPRPAIAPAPEGPPSAPMPATTSPPAPRPMPIAPILTEKELHVTLEDCLRTRSFQGLALHFSVCHAVALWLGGALPDLLSQVGDPDYFASTLYPLVGNATFLFTPFVAQTLEEKGFGVVLGYTVASLQATIVLALVPRLWPQMLTLTAFCLARSFLYVGTFAFIALNYPIQHFGPLLEVLLSRALVVGLLLFPLLYFQQAVLGGAYPLLGAALLLGLTALYRLPWLLHRPGHAPPVP